jgi:hypothetical protein
MEDVLDVYSQQAPATSQPPKEPVENQQPVEAIGQVRLCFDERPCQLIGQVIAPLPMESDKPLR